MKKVLFATTALIATAGIASADVALSGSAEMGVFGGDGIETQFHTDIDVTFTLSGESDNGITFGAAVDLDENSAFTPSTTGGIAIFVSGDFGTLTMGDTDGALDFAMTEAWVGNAGSIGDNETAHDGALGSYGDGAYDGQILRYDYSFGDFAVAASVEMDDTGANDTGYAVGATYTFAFGGGSATVGGGYQAFDISNVLYVPGNLDSAVIGSFTNYDVSVIGVSAAVALDSGLQLAVQYSVWNGDDNNGGNNDFELTHVGVGAGYSFDAVTVSANYGMWTIDDGFGANYDVNGFGVAAAYDFGGGLSAHVGYGMSEYSGSASADTNDFSLGLSMSF